MSIGMPLKALGVLLVAIGMFGVGWYYASEPKLIQEHNINEELQVGGAYPVKFIAEKGNVVVIKGEARGPNGNLVPINLMIDGKSNVKISKDPNDFSYHVGRTPLMSPFEYKFSTPFTGEFEVSLEYWPKDLDKWPLKATIMATVSVYDESYKKNKLLMSGIVAALGFIVAMGGVVLDLRWNSKEGR